MLGFPPRAWRAGLAVSPSVGSAQACVFVTAPVLPFANPPPSQESLPPEPQDVLPEAGTRGQVVVLGRPLVCDKFRDQLQTLCDP